MAHPHADIRQSKVEHSRVAHITKGYASGGGVMPGESNAKIQRKAVAQRDAQAVEGGSAKERQDRPNRARGGRTKSKGTNVNVIIAPQGGANAAPPMPPPGVAGPMPGPAPMPPRPMMPPPGVPPIGAGGPPPGIRSVGGRAYAKGGAVKSGRAFEEGKRLGTQVQNNPSGKNDQVDIGRGKVITYATGGPVEAPKGKTGPKMPGGGRGGLGRLAKAKRAAKTYAKA